MRSTLARRLIRVRLGGPLDLCGCGEKEPGIACLLLFRSRSSTCSDGALCAGAEGVYTVCASSEGHGADATAAAPETCRPCVGTCSLVLQPGRDKPVITARSCLPSAVTDPLGIRRVAIAS